MFHEMTGLERVLATVWAVLAVVGLCASVTHALRSIAPRVEVAVTAAAAAR